jgi:creatinine amidohydrolase
MVMALAPETVHMDKAVANYPPVFPSPLLSTDGRPACAWSARDFGPSGIIGDPRNATPEQGQQILDSLAISWAKAIEELHHLEWAPRAEPTWERAHFEGFIQQENL